jgi:hypothetical protein
VRNVLPEALAKVGAVMLGLPGPLFGLMDIRKEYFDAIMGANTKIIESPAITPGMGVPLADVNPMTATKRKVPGSDKKVFLRRRNAA